MGGRHESCRSSERTLRSRSSSSVLKLRWLFVEGELLREGIEAFAHRFAAARGHLFNRGLSRWVRVAQIRSVPCQETLPGVGDSEASFAGEDEFV